MRRRLAPCSRAQPGLGPVRYYSTFRVRDGSPSGRSPFVPVKGPEQNVNYGFGLGGALITDKSSFNLNVYGINSYDTPNLNAALPDGTQALALGLKAPRDNLYVNGQLDYALTLDQTLRLAYNLTRVTNNNLGVGGYDEARARVTRPRATSTTCASSTLVRSGDGRSGGRGSSSSGPTPTRSRPPRRPPIVVLDAFTSGGAQMSGGDHARTLDLASDLDYVLGAHSLRAGILLDGGWYHSDSLEYLGTYTFDNLQAYLANQPSNYTRRVGRSGHRVSGRGRARSTSRTTSASGRI